MNYLLLIIAALGNENSRLEQEKEVLVATILDQEKEIQDLKNRVEQRNILIADMHNMAERWPSIIER